MHATFMDLRPCGRGYRIHTDIVHSWLFLPFTKGDQGEFPCAIQSGVPFSFLISKGNLLVGRSADKSWYKFNRIGGQ